MTESAWYRRWFGEDYLTLYAHRSDEEARRQVAAVLGVWGSAPSPLLDIACGSGRHTRAFAQKGVHAIGLDLSAPLVHRARGARVHRPRGTRVRGSRATPTCYVRGDMLQLPFRSGSFPAVVSFFTSIGYFETDRENEAVLREMARVLAPGGRLVLDTFRPGPTIERLVPEEEKTIDRHKVTIRRWYDRERRRLNKEITFGSGGARRSYLESVRAYEDDELARLADAAGLEVLDERGAEEDGTLLPPGRPGPRLMLFAEKRGGRRKR